MRLTCMLAVLTASATLVMAADVTKTPEPKVPEFRSRVKNYTELVDRLEKNIGKLPDRAEPEQINAHKHALAAAIKQARAGAKQGDIFVAAEQPILLNILKTETQGKQGAPARQVIADDNPKGPSQAEHKTPSVKLAVNATYPDGAPRSTVPPTMLLRLPKLPETIEFRFVGKALVLYDPRANIIVDFLPNAL